MTHWATVALEALTTGTRPGRTLTYLEACQHLSGTLALGVTTEDEARDRWAQIAGGLVAAGLSELDRLDRDPAADVDPERAARHLRLAEPLVADLHPDDLPAVRNARDRLARDYAATGATHG